MLHDVVRARKLALRDVAPAIQLCTTSRPRNIPLALTMKNDGHGSISMELRERALGLQKLRYEPIHL